MPSCAVHAPPPSSCRGALPGARKHFETSVPAVRVRLALLPWDLDGSTEMVLVSAAIQVAVPEREHSANARDTRRLRRMAKTKGRFHVLPHPLLGGDRVSVTTGRPVSRTCTAVRTRFHTPITMHTTWPWNGPFALSMRWGSHLAWHACCMLLHALVSESAGQQARCGFAVKGRAASQCETHLRGAGRFRVA